MSELTHVELTWLKKRIENWIRFGRIVGGWRLSGITTFEKRDAVPAIHIVTSSADGP